MVWESKKTMGLFTDERNNNDGESMITKVIFSILARAVHEQWLHDFSLFSD